MTHQGRDLFGLTPRTEYDFPYDRLSVAGVRRALWNQRPPIVVTAAGRARLRGDHVGPRTTIGGGDDEVLPELERGRGGRLFSATLGVATPAGTMVAFSAAIMADERSFRVRLDGKFGPFIAPFAAVAQGINDQDPLVQVLVTKSLRDMLVRTEAQLSRFTSGLDLHIEQRFGVDDLPRC